jgi:N6-adenosine-specific RNA methylase IME4
LQPPVEPSPLQSGTNRHDLERSGTKPPLQPPPQGDEHASSSPGVPALAVIKGCTSRGEWVGRINSAFRHSVTAIIETGKLLIAAKRALPGEFEAMVERDLDFGPRTARRLMAIAADRRLRTHGSALPPSWRTLYELTRLDDDTFAAAVASGTINAEMQRKDVLVFLSDRRNGALASQPLSPPSGKYSCIVVDPPWPMQKIAREVDAEPDVGFDYPTMDIAALQTFGATVKAIAADDCHLFLWTTQKFLPEAFGLLDLWDFRYVFTMVWHKAGGFQPFGLAQYNCEFVLYARRGTPKFIETTAFNCCFGGARRDHSRKPDEFYSTIRRVTAGPHIDMFARSPRDGWAVWGNEAEVRP